MSKVTDLVVHSVEGRVARITLNRPDEQNRFIAEMMRQFIEGLRSATAADADVLLIDAAGEDFTVGRDQTERPAGMTKRDGLALILEGNALLTSFAGLTITAVQGKARGFGAGLSVQSDLCIAASTTTVAFDEIKHGFPPTIVMTYLESYVGPKRALDLVATGRVLTATEAEMLGIVSRVVDRDALPSAAQATVEGLLSQSPEAVRSCKRFLREIRSVPPADRGEYALKVLVG